VKENPVTQDQTMQKPTTAVWKDRDGDYVTAELAGPTSHLWVQASSNGAYFTRAQWDQFSAAVVRIFDAGEQQ
jgi:hypothetical protein